MASNTVKLIGKCSAPLTFNPKRRHTIHHLVLHQVTGGSLKESREALEIAETDGRLFCTVGVHPTRCGEFEESGDPEGHFQALLALAKEGIEKGKVL
uniref:Putative deoxyribonuclease TATDN1 n=1 Tax=Aegilops tauschii TaxID=37682 RepID=N1QWD0_AEGTA